MINDLIQKVRSGDKKIKEEINNTPYPYSIDPFLIIFNEVVFKIEDNMALLPGKYDFFIKPYNHYLLVSPSYTEDVLDIFNRHKKYLKRMTETVKAYYRLFKYSGKEMYSIDREDLMRLTQKYVKRFTNELNTPKIEQIFTEPIDKNCISQVFINNYAHINLPFKRLTISEKMRYLPKKLIKYIIYHEIFHFIEQAHNKRFKDAMKAKFLHYNRWKSEFAAYHLAIKDIVFNL